MKFVEFIAWGYDRVTFEVAGVIEFLNDQKYSDRLLVHSVCYFKSVLPIPNMIQLLEKNLCQSLLVKQVSYDYKRSISILWKDMETGSRINMKLILEGK